ncbi:hypothetical protein [Methylomagnum sp.]
MNKAAWYLQSFCLSVALAVFSGAAVSADYIYRDLMGNTLPPQKCAAKSEAEHKASDTYNVDKFAKRFCETQGYGWHVSEQKNHGKLVCDECGSNSGEAKYKCHMEDVVVACKRLKPGSVGLFPGEG